MGWETEIPDVVAGQPITSSWGNSIRDSIVHVVPTVAALPMDVAVTDGSVAFVTAVNRLHVMRGHRWWTTRVVAALAKTTSATGVVNLTAADAGLLELTWGTGEIAWTSINVVAVSGSRFQSGQVQVRAIQSTGTPSGSIQVVASAAVTVDAYFEGYATV